MNDFEKHREAARVFFGDLGAWSYDTWQEYNEKYFNNTLVVGAIIWGLTPHGRSLGLYNYGMNQITLHKSLVEPKTAMPWMISYLNKKYASEVLLHEMIHQHISQNTDYTGGGISSHNNQYWVNEVVRLSPLIGLSQVKAQVIKQKRVKGKVTWYTEPGHLTRQQLSSWPHCLRSDDFYKM